MSHETASAGVDERLVLETAMDAGHILLENGAEIFRVEETMDRICRYFGVERRDFFVLSNGIFTTGGQERGENAQPFAQVKHIPVRAAQLGKVVAVNQLSRDIEKGRYTLEQVQRRLEEIRSLPPKPRLAQIAASGVGAACFCYLFGGSLRDALAALAVGLLLEVFILWVSGPHLSRIIGNICCGALITALCLCLRGLGIGDNLSHMVIGSIIPLIPGVPFTNGIRDLVDGDYIAGSVRLLDAMLAVLCVAIGVGVVFIAYHRLWGGAML